MLKYILKRLGLSVLILFGVSVILYLLILLMPGDSVQTKIAGMNPPPPLETQISMYEEDRMVDTPEDLAQRYMDELESKGLYDKLEEYQKESGFVHGQKLTVWEKTVRIFKTYGEWFLNACKLDFGTSSANGNAPVINVIVKNMGTSFGIALIATIFEFLIAIPLGITAATHQYSFRDYVVTVLVMIGISLPSFFLGQILKYLLSAQFGPDAFFFANGSITNTETLKGIDLLIDYFRHFFIPILTVIVLSIGGRMRMTRTNMLEVMNSDYIRTARAKGLKEKVVIYKHAFRNTLIPLVTSLAGLLPSLFSGAIITEQMFGIEGIGNIAFKAMTTGDTNFIMGYNIFLALLSIIGILLSDIMYAVVDPRVKLS